MILEIKHFTNFSGAKLCSVPLVNSDKRVTLFEDDLHALVDRGISLTWKLSLNKVFLAGRKTKGSSIARLVMDAGPKDKLRFRDKDPTNLRRDNILMTTSKDIALGDIVVTHTFE